jgi:hypothetical protein
MGLSDGDFTFLCNNVFVLNPPHFSICQMPKKTFKPITNMTPLERTKYCLAYQTACHQYENLLEKYRHRYVDLLAKAQDEIHKLHVRIINLESQQRVQQIHLQEDSDTEPESESDPEPKQEVIDLTK